MFDQIYYNKNRISFCFSI